MRGKKLLHYYILFKNRGIFWSYKVLCFICFFLNFSFHPCLLSLFQFTTFACGRAPVARPGGDDHGRDGGRQQRPSGLLDYSLIHGGGGAVAAWVGTVGGARRHREQHHHHHRLLLVPSNRVKQPKPKKTAAAVAGRRPAAGWESAPPSRRANMKSPKQTEPAKQHRKKRTGAGRAHPGPAPRPPMAAPRCFRVWTAGERGSDSVRCPARRPGTGRGCPPASGPGPRSRPSARGRPAFLIFNKIKSLINLK